MTHAPLAAQFRSWNDLVNALITSPNALEREHFFQGVIDGSTKPLLIARELLDNHALVTGATGSGKSSCALTSWCVQAERRRDTSLLYFDLKGDSAMFATLAIEARRSRINFRWFTTESSKSSYIFNPFLDPFWQTLSLNEQTQIQMPSYGLDHGDAKAGTGYFEAVNEARLRGAIARAPGARSFKDLHAAITAPGLREELGMSRRDYENSGNVQAILNRLSQSTPQNAVPGDGTPESAFRGAITIEEILTRPGVVYFWLPSTVEATSNRIFTRLSIRMLVAAARIRGRSGPQKYVVIDECQEVMQKSLAAPIKQARDLGISFWLACQNLSDLATPGVDFLNVVLGNTSVRVHFSATDPLAREYITRSSGEAVRIVRSRADTVTQFEFGHQNVGVSHQRQEQIVPRYTQDDVNRLNATPGLCLFEATPKAGFTRLNYPVFVRAPFTMSAAEYQRRRDMPWPAPNRSTVVNRADAGTPAVEGVRPTPEALPGPPTAEPEPEVNVSPPIESRVPRRRTRDSHTGDRGRRPVAPPADAPHGTEPAVEPTATPEPDAANWADYLRQLAGPGTGPGGLDGAGTAESGSPGDEAS